MMTPKQLHLLTTLVQNIPALVHMTAEDQAALQAALDESRLYRRAIKARQAWRQDRRLTSEQRGLLWSLVSHDLTLDGPWPLMMDDQEAIRAALAEIRRLEDALCASENPENTVDLSTKRDYFTGGQGAPGENQEPTQRR